MSDEVNLPVNTSNGLSEDLHWTDGSSGSSRRRGTPKIGYSSQDGLVRIVITNDISNESARGALGHFETDMKKLANVISQATNANTYFSAKTKSINPATGKAFYEMYIQQSELANAEQALRYQLGKMGGSGGADYKYAYEQVKYAKTYLNLYGKQAQSRAKAEIADVAGGKILPAPTEKNPDRFKALIPLPDDVSEKDRAWIDERKKAIFQESIALSNIEKNRRKKEEEELETERQLALIQKEFKEVQKARLDNARIMQKLEEEELKEKANVDKQVAKYFEDEEAKKIKEEKRKEKETKKEEEKEAKVEARWKKYQKDEIAKLKKKNEEDFPIADKEAFVQNNIPVAEAKSDEELLELYREADKFNESIKQSDEQAKREAEEEQKEIAESMKRTTAILKVISTVAVVAVDLLRRMLTAMVNTARETERQGVEARNLGMNTTQVREANIFDESRGLKKGTTLGAIKTLQGKFGDVTNIDTASLGILARVMGSGVSEMVNSGMGGSAPDTLLEHILDKYFEQFKSGKNSLGQQVGQVQARRELTTVLAQVSPEIAQLFSKMADDYSSGMYKFSNYKEWMSTFMTNRTGLFPSETGLSEEVGKKINEIIAIVDDLKNSFFTRLANSMDGLISNIKNIRAGMSDESQLELDFKNKEKNLATEKRLKEEIAVYNKTAQEGINEFSDGIVPTKIKGGKDFNYTAEILAKIATGDIDEKYLMSTKPSNLGVKKWTKQTARDYIARGQEINSSILFSSAGDEVARIITIFGILAQLEEENAKEIGDNIKEILFTPNAENVAVQSMVSRLIKSTIDSKNDIYGDDWEVKSEPGDKFVQEAYRRQLKENPERLEALKYLFFGIPTDNTELARHISTVEGTAVSWKKVNVAMETQRFKDTLSKAKAKAEKEKGRKLTYAEEKALEDEIAIARIAELNAPFAFKTQQESNLASYANAGAEQIARSVGVSDSAIWNRLLSSPDGFTIEKGKSYNMQGQFNNGVYSVDINITDAKGEKSTRRIELGTMDYGNFSQTIDSNGNLVSNSTNM